MCLQTINISMEGEVMSYRTRLLLTGSMLALAGATLTSVALADDDHDRPRKQNRFFAELKPTNEVPALSSTGSGKFKATIDEANQTITYELSYQALEAAPGQAHIHIGQRSVNGGVTVFLCGNAPTVPPAAIPQPPACPPSPATVSGVLTADMIVGPAGQGIAATTAAGNEFAELVALLRDGVTYVNVHTVKFPGGEVRGQIYPQGRRKGR
jgi:hypothetical protein